MTFNENARIRKRGVQKRRGGTAAAVGGGGILVVVVLAVISQITGVNLMPFADVATNVVQGGSSSGENVAIDSCDTGADANADDECRMVAAADALNQYWETQVRGYEIPQLVLFDGSTQSACGTASAQTGPFYCPTEQGIYLDTDFFGTLSRDYGASTGALAQMYVLAHEWGHHITNLLGDLGSDRGTGATSNTVRVELQADCFAGAWVGDATVATDETGVPLLEPITRDQLGDALSAAAAVGDDHIMESAGVDVNPDRFTHGTSEQRQRWFITGYESGPAACDTFAVSGADL